MLGRNPVELFVFALEKIRMCFEYFGFHSNTPYFLIVEPDTKTSRGVCQILAERFRRAHRGDRPGVRGLGLQIRRHNIRSPGEGCC